MKKLLAVVLSLCMLVTAFGVVAAAEETTDEITELNWADIEETITAENGWEGDFVTFDEIAVKIWVPTAMEAVELTDEDREDGYIGYYQTEDGSYVLAVSYVDAGGMSLDEYAELLSQADGISSVSIANVNGIGMVGYNMEETDTAYCAAVTEAGYVLEFAFYPLSDENFSSVIGVMTCSIQAAEEE